MSGPLDIRPGDVWKTRVGSMLRIKPINKPPIGNPAFNVPAACIDDPTRTTIWLNKEGRFLGEADHYLDLIELVTRELLGPMETNTPRAGEPAGARDRNTDREQVAVLSFAREPSFVPVEGYGPLARVLEDAYEQSAAGKGKERHANGRPFLKQPIMEIGRMLSSTCDGQLYQAIKKAQEASGMIAREDFEAAERELLGGIVYLAAAVLLVREKRNA